jgi:site-specific DNA-methyltransferase (adenine-specific)
MAARATVKLLRGDCLEVMRGLAEASVDAVITDPPYCSGGVTEAGRGRANGQGLRKGHGRFQWFDGDNMTTPGLAFLLRSVACEALRVVRPTGHLLVFCDWRMVAALAPAVESAGWRYRSLIVWNKGAAGLGLGFRMQHEMVLHFANRGSTFHATDVGNVITTGRMSHRTRIHPTEKPVDLLRPLIRVTTPEGGMVLDPFAGSGATLHAARLEGRSAIGIERDAGYLAAATERLAA